MNAIFENIDTLHPAVAKLIGQPMRFVTPRRTRVVMSHRYGAPVYFTVNNSKDRIHARQTKGRFYEEEELALIADNFPKGGSFCDVGANIGNHSLYMLKFGGAAQVLPMEPNPDALELYLSNMILNGVLDRIALDTLGYGLDEQADDGLAIVNPRNNLGWARVGKPDEGKEGAISVRRGDDLIGARHIDFLKMDVEGMEVRALKGLAETIKRCRPVIFIEVDHGQRAAFDALMDELGYTVKEALPSHRVNQNLLLVPAS